MNKSCEQKTINLDACRFCLKISRSKISIDKEIKSKFKNLIHEEFSDNPKLPQVACKSCVSDIEKSLLIKNKIFNNQRFLLGLADADVKEEPEAYDNEEYFESSLEIKEETVEIEVEDTKFPVPDFEFENYNSPSPEPESSHTDDDYKPEEIRKKIEYDENGKRKKVECVDCGKFLADNKRLRMHRERFHPSNDEEMMNFLKKEEILHSDRREKVICSDCGLQLYKFNLPKHQINMHGYPSDHVYICDLCGSFLTDKTGILAHMKKRHIWNKGKIPCDICGKQYANKKNLREHRSAIHDNKITDVCDLCGAQFKTRPAYQVHFRSQHSGEKPYKCTECFKQFFSCHALRNHKNNQHANHPETCKICKKVYKSQFYLKSHMQIVHEERKFLCTVEGCGFKFATKNKLRNHMFKHSDFKKFVCKVCDAGFKSRDGLFKHVHSIHLKLEVNCVVPECQATFHRKDYLRTHIKRKHRDLGEAELQRMDKAARDIMLPNVKTYYKNLMNAADADKYNSHRYENMPHKVIYGTSNLKE